MGNNKNTLQSHSLRPYDDFQWDDLTMYNKMPYKWDEDLYQEKNIQLYSGNLIKSYRCNKSEPIEIKH